MGTKGSKVGGSLGSLFVIEFKDELADLLLSEIDLEEDVFKCHKKYLIISIKLPTNYQSKGRLTSSAAFHLKKK